MHDFSAKLHENDFVQAIMDGLPCGVILLDHQARVVTVNKALEQILGPASQVIGKGAGQAIGCIWPEARLNGCGNADACADCGLRSMVLSAANGRRVVNETATLELLVDGRAKFTTLRLNIAPISVRNRKYAVMTLLDTGPLKPAPVTSPETSFHNMIGTDPKMRALFDLIRNVSTSETAVLIQGESGTGKELVAAAIHKESHRRGRPFVPFNCGALPEGIVESELFGHVKGAFTGAVKDKRGRFELAHSGTLFLDEVGELAPAVQVKLLRVLQDGTFERVGDEKANRTDVRIISATNKDLNREVSRGRFRQDLFYRLCVIPVQLPPLRDRKGDIPLLAQYFLDRYAQTDGPKHIHFSPKAMDLLKTYHWPGNVRELQNVVQFALINTRDSRIAPSHLPPHLRIPFSLQRPVKERRRLDASNVFAALARTNGNKQEAAKLLGVSRSTLYRFFSSQEKESPI